MARELKAKRNALEILDQLSGDVITLYYRMPTNDERVAYQNAFFVRQGEEIVYNDNFSIRLEFGGKILIGFKNGDFTVDQDPISSDPADPNYRADWMDLVTEMAGDMVAMLGMHVFAMLAVKTKTPEKVIENLAKPVQDAPAVADPGVATADSAPEAAAEVPAADPLS